MCTDELFYSCFVRLFTDPSHWVPLPLLWESMHKIDPDTQRPRGFILVKRSEAWGGMMHGCIRYYYNTFVTTERTLKSCSSSALV
jgi:Phytochelatin synthase